MADFKDFFTEYAKLYSRSESHAFGSDLSALIDKISGRRYGKALDIATGTGFTAIAISTVCDEVVALDATTAMLEEARKNASLAPESHRISFVEGLAENTGFPDSTFDLVTCRRAAHHFPDKPGFIREVRRILKDDGVFALVDMISAEKDEDHMLDHLETLRDHSHIHAASLSEWTSYMNEAGLKVVDSLVEVEKKTFEKWLYPVEPDSIDGKRSLEFINANKKRLAAFGGWDLESDLFVKQRGIIKAIPR